MCNTLVKKAVEQSENTSSLLDSRCHEEAAENRRKYMLVGFSQLGFLFPLSIPFPHLSVFAICNGKL